MCSYSKKGNVKYVLREVIFCVNWQGILFIKSVLTLKLKLKQGIFVHWDVVKPILPK